MSRTITLVSGAIVVVVGTLRLGAQQPSAAASRTDVQQAVRAYVDAFNKADAGTLVDMYSREPEVTSVSDSRVLRGWDAIRSASDSIAAEGKYKVSIGSIDVIPLGNDYAVALTSTILRVTSGEEGAQRPGAMTFVLKKVGGAWKIIHDHASTGNSTSGAGASPAASAVRPRPMSPDSAGAAPQPPALAAEEPMRFAIADEVAIVRPGRFVYYQFSVSIPSPCIVRGQIVGLAGRNKDFQAFIMDDHSFLNWRTNHEGHVYWQSGRVTAADLGVRLTGPSMYYLVISNEFSRFTAKTVKVQAFTEC